MNKKYELVIWDCDGVLVDSEAISSRVFTKIIQDLGGQVPEQEVHEALRGGSIGRSIDFVRQHVSIPVDMNIEQHYRKMSFDYFKRELKQISGVEDVLKSLNIPVCIASNGPKIKIMYNLGITGLDVYFNENAIFSGHDLDAFKPSPDLFIYAAKTMGVLPEKCVVIEDSEHGAKAAKQAEMACFGYCAETKESVFLKYNAIPFKSMNSLLKLLTIHNA
jgi:HAD superfamily hydrolase (TIGR01509 family)